MTVLLVILTFFILCGIGTLLEYRKKKAEKKNSQILATPVFAQDGGKPIEEEKKEE